MSSGRPRTRRARPPGRGTIRSEINVTPLVDVVLVLLIIFMVVTPMLSRGAKVELPDTQHHQSQNDTGKQVLLSVTADGKIFVEADGVEERALPEALRRAIAASRATGGTGEVHLKGDKRIKYGALRPVLEAVHAAGASGVALGTQEAERARAP
ncbi:MAG: biopolymer transporter ExbD [Deltaproteobacteria bacterium]|nr:biopolymer transporter ExbD [Deltaproteobacteria bacterium]